MGSLGVGLIQQDWCPYKSVRLRCRHTQRQDHVKIQGENSHLQARREAKEKPTLPTPWSSNSNIQKCEEIYCCCLSHSVCAMTALENQCTPQLASDLHALTNLLVPFLTGLFALSPSFTSSYLIYGLWPFFVAVMMPLHRLPFPPCLPLDLAHIPYPLKNLVEHSRWKHFSLPYTCTAYPKSMLPFFSPSQACWRGALV